MEEIEGKSASWCAASPCAFPFLALIEPYIGSFHCVTVVRWLAELEAQFIF